MAFLKSSLVSDLSPVMKGDRVALRPMAMADYPAWAELRAKSRQHLVPWEPAWSNDELTKAAFRLRVRLSQRDMRDDLGFSFFIFARSDSALLGGISLTNIRRGASQSASVGYWMGVQHAGKGYMSEAASLMLAFAFDSLALHRVEAACMPANAASIRVLTKLGFKREGLARHYLRIDGTWQDHVLFGIVLDEWRANKLNRGGGGGARGAA